MSEFFFATHWWGCWKESGHQKCAAALLERAEDLIAELYVDSIPEAVRAKADEWCLMKNGPKPVFAPHTDKES